MRLGQGVTVGILSVRNEAPAQRVRAWHTGLEGGADWGEPLEPLEILDRAQAARGRERADDLVLAALIMGGRAEATG